MITLYHLDTSRSERVIWLMEELGLEYKLENLKRLASGLAPAELKSVHPLGHAPVIRDGDVVLAESGAILEYIIHRHGGGRLSVPPSAPGYARYLYWMHSIEGTLGSHITAQVLLDMAGAGEGPVGAMIKSRVKELLEFVDGELAATTYVAGDEFTAADILLAYPFTTMRKFTQLDLTPYPGIQSYIQRIQARSAYQKAMTIAGNAALPA